MNGTITEITYRQAVEFLLPKHYSGRTPVICKAFGWFHNDELQAVVTFGKPASPSLCDSICGKEYRNNVYELNRLCRLDTWKEPLSQFVSYCLRKLKQLDWIIVSYSDTAMNHHGYIYQACNFIYTGCTPTRTDMFSGSKHSRHYIKNSSDILRKVRSAKHRYIYFCTSNRKLKDEWLSKLKYPVKSYPKGDNGCPYKLGDYLKEQYITNNDKTKSFTLSEWLDKVLEETDD